MSRCWTWLSVPKQLNPLLVYLRASRVLSLPDDVLTDPTAINNQRTLRKHYVLFRDRTDKNHRREGSPAKLHLYESDRTNRTLAVGQDDLQIPASWD